VGRAVWKEAVTMTADARDAFLKTTAKQRLSRLTSLCSALGKPWQDFYSPPQLDSNWYGEY
jgi:tagatose-1,6-bisphosphate aldolase